MTSCAALGSFHSAGSSTRAFSSSSRRSARSQSRKRRSERQRVVDLVDMGLRFGAHRRVPSVSTTRLIIGVSSEVEARSCGANTPTRGTLSAGLSRSRPVSARSRCRAVGGCLASARSATAVVVAVDGAARFAFGLERFPDHRRLGIGRSASRRRRGGPNARSIRTMRMPGGARNGHDRHRPSYGLDARIA